MRIFVIGASGQLGTALCQELSTEGVEHTTADRHELDITRAEAVKDAVSHASPTWVVNCAAYTNVERAESERDLAFLDNDCAVGNVADAALSIAARVIHISTDYVFSGHFPDAPPRPYTESDVPAPLNVYGASKLAGERRLLDHDVSATILRTSWLYGTPRQEGRSTSSFLEAMLRLGAERTRRGKPLRVVADQHGTPTDCRSLARQIVALIRSDDSQALEGIVHASCKGETTWYEFATKIFRQCGWNLDVEPISSAEYPTKAPRPMHSVLENRRLIDAGLERMPCWQDGLAETLRQRGGS